MPTMGRLYCYQIQGKVVAIIEIVISILFILFFALIGVTFTVKKNELIEGLNKDENGHTHLRKLLEASWVDQLSIFIVPIFYFVGELGLGILLYHSVNMLNYKRLRLWFIITGTLLAVGMIFFLAEVIRHEDFLDVIVITFAEWTFTLYSMWVVYMLIGEIKSGGANPHPVPYNNGFYKL